MDIRKIHLRISGGFAGLMRGAEIAAEDLSAEERRALDRHLAHGEVARADGARDLLQYELEAETDSGARRISFDEMNTPDELAHLIHRLTARAKPIRP